MNAHGESIRVRLSVNPETAGERIDRFIAAAEPTLTRNRVQHLIKAGLVHLNQSVCKANERVAEHDVVEVFIPPPEIAETIPQEMPLDILYEDDALIVINKPAGVAVHPGVGNRSRTLVNGLLHHCPHLPGVGGTERPGVVHRIDKDTTGVLVFSKTDRAHQGLAQQFRTHSIDRRYRALVFGLMPSVEGTFETLIARRSDDRTRFTSHVVGYGKQAITHWRLLDSFGGMLSLLELKLETGRTHQIRVHLADHGYPVVGDQTYGATARRLRSLPDPVLQELLAPVERQLLHAYRLGFRHPVSGRLLLFTVDDPPDFGDVLVALTARYQRSL